MREFNEIMDWTKKKAQLLTGSSVSAPISKEAQVKLLVDPSHAPVPTYNGTCSFFPHHRIWSGLPEVFSPAISN